MRIGASANFQSIRAECRAARGAAFGASLIQDARFGWRMLGKNPGFAAVSVLSLGVGIAVNMAVFSCLNALVFRATSGGEGSGAIGLFARNVRRYALRRV